MRPYSIGRISCFAITVFSILQTAYAEDWDQIAIPAKLPAGKFWKQLDISDSFEYEAAPLDKPLSFSNRWNERFINEWKGPGLTHWTVGHAYVTGGHLGIASTRMPGTNKVRTGCISSKTAFKYPLFVETSIRISNQVLASNVCMLSKDSTQEIDIVEAYGSDRTEQKHFAERIHLSHHVFVREPFQDYQPTDEGSWYYNGTTWREGFHRVGVFWRDPWTLEYYVNGKLVRTVFGKSKIDPNGFTGGKGLTKPMQIIINMEDQEWRSDNGITPTDDELNNLDNSIMWVDWIRVYKPVDEQ